MSDERRTRGHLTWDWVDRRLPVATADPAGRPDAVPVWFWWDGERVYFSTKAGSRKAGNLLRRPSVVLHNGDGADPIILKRVQPRRVLAWEYANCAYRTDWELD